MENENQVFEGNKEYKEKTNNNYFKETFMKNLILNIIIIIVSIALFIIEFFYRTPLFNYSIDFENNLQEKASEATITTFTIFTKIGGEYLMVVPIIIILWFFTLIKSYVYLTGFIFCLQFHSMMKIWYGNKRPFWENSSLYKGICDGGFGNPSGHSIITTYVYLSLFIYYKQTKRLKGKYFIIIIILIFCLFWTLMIILSRIILGMHSLNQVIYGTSLGIIFSVLIFIVFRVHQIPVSNYKKFFREKCYIYKILGIFCFFIILTFINIPFFNKGFDKDKYDKLLDRVCEKKVAKYRRFNLDGLSGSITVLAMLGMYLGQIVFWYLIENKYKYNELSNIKNRNELYEINKNDIELEDQIEILNDDSVDDLINHWNKNRIYICENVKNVLIVILVIIICFIPAILFIAIPSDSNVYVIFIFKIGIPMLTLPFLFFGFGFYFIIKISCGSKELLIKRLEENYI